MKRSPQGSVSRARWAAVGAAIAVSLGIGGVAVTNAIVSTGDKAVFVPISPCRLFDLRPAPVQVGPRSAPLGPGEVFTQAVRGANGNCDIPADATAVAMNVTAVDGTAGSFLTVWPSDVTPRPLASNLNWVPGSPPTPNKVDVKLSADGKINFFNLAGSVSVLADVVGYYADHNHDDRYYTKAAIDAKLSADITVTNGLVFVPNAGIPPASVGYYTDVTQVTVNISGASAVQLPIVGPKSSAGAAFRFKSVTYCILDAVAPAAINFVSVESTAPTPAAVDDGTPRSAAGCYTVTDLSGNLASSTHLWMFIQFSGASGQVKFTSVTTTWTPV